MQRLPQHVLPEGERFARDELHASRVWPITA
jgi:hypothetical protein